MSDPKLFRALVEVEVIYEADGPKHAVDYARASIQQRIVDAANGLDIAPALMPDRRFEHCSAKAEVRRVEILSRNGEVQIEGNGPLGY